MNAAVDQKVVSISSGMDFVSMMSQHSTSVEIGADLLGLSNNDSNESVLRKIDSAVRRHPEHVMEILLTGLSSILYTADSKEESIQSCMFAISMADRHLSCC